MPSAALPAALATSRLVKCLDKCLDKSLDIVDPGPFAAEDDRARTTASFAKAANVKQAELAPRFKTRLPTTKKPAGLTGGLSSHVVRAALSIRDSGTSAVISRSAGVTWRGGFPPMSCRAGCRASIRTKASGLR